MSGEDYLKEEFDRVIRDDAISGATRDVVERAYQCVTRGHAAVSALKHQLAE